MKLLLDSHIKKATIQALSRRCAQLDAVHIADWREGALRTAEDEDILVACYQDNSTFITYDQRTVPGLLRRWAMAQRSHSGVIFGGSDSVPANDPGAVAGAIAALTQEMGSCDMTNVVRYMRRPGFYQ